MRFYAWRGPAIACVLLAVAAGATLRAQPAEVHESPPDRRAGDALNSSPAQAQHYVVLVALDGFRSDYAQPDRAPHLLALGKQGTWAPEGMLPSFPALGVPNRFTIVTGLYPGHHDIVADRFYDPERKARFSAGDSRDSADAAWYKGVPLWSLAESQGMRAAVAGWPGSEAEIGGYRPTYSAPSGGKDEAKQREEQILKWLHLAADRRPHFIAVDFPEPAEAARRFGPDAPETLAAVKHADEFIGRLKAGLDATGLPVDLVVVSDRGMAKREGAWITLDQFTSLAGFMTDGPLIYGENEQQREHVYRQLNHVSSFFVVYRRKDMPPDTRMSTNLRVGDPVVMAAGPYAIRAQGPAAGQPDTAPPAGIDGLDPEAPQMRAIFFAAGPDIVPGKTVALFENVNLYAWMAHMLGLKAPKSDGSLNILAGTLRDDGAEPSNETKP
jgi:hypothetical protein